MQPHLPQPAAAEPAAAEPDIAAPAAAASEAAAQPPQPLPEDAAAMPVEAPAAANPAAETAPPDEPAAPEPAVEPAPEAEAGPAAAPGAPAAPAPGLSPAVCGAKLIELFPALFAQGQAFGPMKPMKLRIQADLQQRAPGVFSRRTLGIFFSRYTTSNAYLKALTLAPHRFDLDGQPAGEISDEHRGMAAEELARRHALAAERRAAQRPVPAPMPRRETPAAEGPTTEGSAAGGPVAAPAGPAAPRRPPRAQPRPAPPHDMRRDQRPPPQGDRAPMGERPAMPARPARPQRPERPERRDRDERRDRRDGPDRGRGEHMPQAAAPALAALPVDPAQRERALLLRSYDASPLSKANFCALKGIAEADLDAALAQAQSERARR